MGLREELRLNKSVLEVTTLDEQGDDLAYWQSKTHEERLQALEFLRQVHFGYDPATTRLQRVLEVVEYPPR